MQTFIILLELALVIYEYLKAIKPKKNTHGAGKIFFVWIEMRFWFIEFHLSNQQLKNKKQIQDQV